MTSRGTNRRTGFLMLVILTAGILHAQSTEELQRRFVGMRFGIFVHFGIMTFTGAAWATPNQDVAQFSPDSLDCGQWADAAAAAGMKFGILTAKHHDGFCLWNSRFTENDVAATGWRNGKGDVVREFVDAFRSRGLQPCLYYSVWDNTAGIGNGPVTCNDLNVIEGQLTELLTSYGKIPLLFIDGWSWKMGHRKVPYDTLRALVKRLQPECLLVDNTHLRCLYDNDLVHYEDGSPFPLHNTLPALFSLKVNRDGGNDWFWDPAVPSARLLRAEEIADTISRLEPQWCSFVLNCPPNRKGKLDDRIVALLKNVGQTWTPDISRPPLPPQPPHIDVPVTPADAYATDGDAAPAIDGLNDRFTYTVWRTTASLPQSITIDLGRPYEDIGILSCVPAYQPYIDPRTEGSITSCVILTSRDGGRFDSVAVGKWRGDTSMKTVLFGPVPARFVRLVVRDAVGGFAAATEISIGRRPR